MLIFNEDCNKGPGKEIHQQRPESNMFHIISNYSHLQAYFIPKFG